MIKKQIAIVLSGVFILGLASLASAGQVKLVSDIWDYVAKVEVVKGLNAPTSGPKQTFTDVKKNQIVTIATDKLCYRRPNNPDDPNSGMGNWSCANRLISGVEKFSLR